MNDQTVAFECIYNIFSISGSDLTRNTNILAELYNVDADEFISEMLMFRVVHAGKAFAHFLDFAKFVQCSERKALTNVWKYKKKDFLSA